MNGQIDIPTIIKDYSGLIAVVITALSGFLLWKFQHKAESRFTEKLESQKNEYNKQLEKLRTELSISRDKLNFYLPKQMEVISTLWAKLQDASDLLSDIIINLEITSLENMSSDEIDETEAKIAKFRQQLQDLDTFYPGNTIFFPKDLQDNYKEVNTKFYYYWIQLQNFKTCKELKGERIYIDAILDDIKPLMEVLEQIIKKILAISE